MNVFDKERYEVASNGHLPRGQIQAFVTDSESEHVLREVLEEFQADNFIIANMKCSDAAERLKRGDSPNVLIVDVSGEDQPIILLVELANLLEPDVKVLVIGDRQDANFYRQITKGLGAAEYLYKPLTRSMVSRLFGPFFSNGDYVPDTVRGGRVIGILGTRGGVGVTSIATNLGWYLGDVARRHTLIIDGNIYAGAVSVMLGVKADNGLRVALESPQRVDELFVERSAQKVTERYDSLSSQADLSESIHVSKDAVRQLLSIVKKKYNFIIVDSPGVVGDLPESLFPLYNQKIIVMDPTLPSLRDCLRLTSLCNTNSSSNRPIIVLNKSGQPGALSDAEVEGGLGRRPDVIVPFLPKILNNAEISAKPSMGLQGPYREAIAKLAQEAASITINASPDYGKKISRYLNIFRRKIKK